MNKLYFLVPRGNPNKISRKRKNIIIKYACLFVFLFPFVVNAQVTVAPMSCYPQYATASAMDAAAAVSSATTPFATWKGAYDYAIANGETTINFMEGVYLPGTHGAVGDWGDASGGYDLNVVGMKVNGNGAVIDNSANGSSQLCFATIAANDVTVDGFNFVQMTGNNAGAMLVNANLTGWTISNCNFDHNDWAGDGLVVNMGSTGQGTITGCNFYGHVQSTGSAMTVNGSGASSSSDLDIINTVYSCNSRIVAGGAVRILAYANVDYAGCTFDGNETNSASGGAISIEENSVVTFTNTVFTCNTAIVNVQDDGGAMHIIEGSDVAITGCTFTGNQAQDKGGAIHVSGASASLITLDIDNTTFDGNSTITPLSSGGAIYLNDANTTLDGSYFTGNIVNAGNGEGGAIYVDKGNNTTTYTFNSNTFTGNAASGSCTGIDLFTEMAIAGSNNDLQFLADGHHLSEQPGSLQFTNGDDCDALANWTTTNSNVTSNGNTLQTKGPGLSYANQVESGSGTLYWTFAGWTASSLSGLGSGTRAMVFVLGGDNSDFNTGDGYAIVKGREASHDEDVEFISYSGGLYGTHSVIHNLGTTSSESGYITFKATYDPATSDWTFYWTSGSSTAGPLANESDPRGYNYCMSDGVSTMVVVNQAFDLSTYPNVGPAWSASSSSNFATWNSYYFRAGDETSGTGGSGSGISATCSTCLSTTNPTDDCVDQGSISGITFADNNENGIDDEGALDGVIVELFNCDGSPTGISVTTGLTGEFYFGSLENGSCYYLVFTQPGGFYETEQDASGSNATNDSDMNVANNQSPQITINTSPNSVNENDAVANETHYVTVDAGFRPTPLPVELISFIGQSKDCQSALSWRTASETNNHYFEIQRSSDGRDFTTIDLVYGAGNSDLVKQYTYIDKSPAVVLCYYRLKQVDFDKAYSYSPVVSISRESCVDEVSIIAARPNPFSNEVTFELFSTVASDQAVLQYYNMLGLEVLRETISVNQGINNLRINTSVLPSGPYFVRFIAKGQDSALIKIVKY